MQFSLSLEFHAVIRLHAKKRLASQAAGKMQSLEHLGKKKSEKEKGERKKTFLQNKKEQVRTQKNKLSHI